MKKFLELFIVVWSIFFLIYFLSYMFYFDDMCKNFKKPNILDDRQTINQIWACKSSLVCSVDDIETNKQNIIIDWSCNKKINESLESETYITYLSDRYFSLLNKFSSND